MCRKKGFTLVELLIVIVVIGVLSAMMMLSSTEAVSSAKATNIINNLRNWKTAALEWYADHTDIVNDKGKIKTSDTDNSYSGNFAANVKAKDILPYLGAGLKEDGDNVKDSSGGVYQTDFAEVNNKHIWCIIYTMPTEDERIKEKLEARAANVLLRNKAVNNSDKGRYTAAQATGVWAKAVAIEVIQFDN